jgi:hypothetical protein
MKTGFVFAFVLLFLVGSFVSAADNNSCAAIGEHYSVVYKNQYPEKCCEGLIAWDSGMDTRIVQNGTCVSRPGMVSGNPVGTCLSCGDGVCDNLENVCNCPKDCDKNISVDPVVNEHNQNISCSIARDCRVTSCGDCINKNQKEAIFCEKPLYDLNYTLSCDCKNNRCESVKNYKIFNLSNGRKAEIKYMPETASAKAIERLGELNFSVVLKEVGNGNETKAVYEVSAEKEGKIFGLFRAKGKVTALVNAETGDVEKVNKPWWAFLATGI